MALGLGIGVGLSRPQQAAAAAAAWHPDDEFADWDMYILADAEDITEADTGVDAWAWRNASTNIFKQATDANRPTFTAEGVLGKPCVTFNGTSDVMLGRNAGNTADAPISTFLAAGGVGLMICVFVTTAVTSTSANAYENDCIVGDDSGAAGMVLHKNNTGPVYSFRAWAWDGTADKADTTISLNTGYVGVWRKPDTTNLYGSVNGGSETSVANGTVSSLTPGVQLGDAQGEEFTGELYLVAAIKAAPTAQEIADIVTNLKTYFGIA